MCLGNSKGSARYIPEGNRYIPQCLSAVLSHGFSSRSPPVTLVLHKPIQSLRQNTPDRERRGNPDHPDHGTVFGGVIGGSCHTGQKR
jgi:hypothetical protein